MNYKLASVISDYYPAIAVVLVILLGFGGFWLYENSKTTYITEQSTTTLYRYKGSFQHRAEVTENNPLWRTGVTIENRPIYFTNITPELEAEFNLELLETGSKEGEVRITANQVLSLSTEEGEKYWENTTELETKTYSLTVGSYPLNFKLDLAQIEDFIENLRENLKFRTGSFRIKIDTVVEIDGEIDGEKVEKEEIYELPINLNPPIYTLGQDLSRTETVTRTVQRKTEKSPTLLMMIYPLTLVIASLIALVYTSAHWWNLDESKLKELKAKEERKKFDEWISEGTISDLDTKATVTMNSLEDLVNAAVDMDKRVILDNERSTYFFVNEELLYSFQPSE